MQSLLRKQYILATISIVVLIIAAVALFGLFSSIKQREARVIDVRDRLASFEQNKRIFSAEAKEFEVIKERVTTLEGNLLTEASIPSLLSSLEDMAKKRGVDFTITAVGEEETHLHIDFSAEGTFASIQSLSEDILSQVYQVAFTRYSLYATDGGKWQLLAGIDMLSF